MKYTDDQLRKMSIHDRHEIWKKCLAALSKSTSPSSLIAVASEIKKQIESLGLPYSEDAAIHQDDPIYLKIWEIINRKTSIALAVEATERGRPALEPLDAIIASELGVDYGGHNFSTNAAGRIVRDMMSAQGYRVSGKQGALGDNSIAKTAAIYVSR